MPGRKAPARTEAHTLAAGVDQTELSYFGAIATPSAESVACEHDPIVATASVGDAGRAGSREIDGVVAPAGVDSCGASSLAVGNSVEDAAAAGAGIDDVGPVADQVRRRTGALEVHAIVLEPFVANPQLRGTLRRTRHLSSHRARRAGRHEPQSHHRRNDDPWHPHGTEASGSRPP